MWALIWGDCDGRCGSSHDETHLDKMRSPRDMLQCGLTTLQRYIIVIVELSMRWRCTCAHLPYVNICVQYSRVGSSSYMYSYWICVGTLEVLKSTRYLQYIHFKLLRTSPLRGVSSCLPACLVSVVRPPFNLYNIRTRHKYKTCIEVLVKVITSSR